MSQFRDSLDNDFMNRMPCPQTTVRNDPSHFPISDPLEEHYRNEEPSFHRGGEGGGGMQMPSLREIRGMNSSSSSSLPPSLPSSSNRGEKSEQGDDRLKIITELTTFSFAIFRYEFN
ncbi:hypothetical protein V1504DRAFT_471771 [Lipomyces starkeyi]